VRKLIVDVRMPADDPGLVDELSPAASGRVCAALLEPTGA